MSERRVAVHGLAEIALRVNDLGAMSTFYQRVLGLEPLGEFPHAVLLRVADGFEGHTQVLGLFDRRLPVSAERGTVDHLAFAVAGRDMAAWRRRLEQLGLEVEAREHAWIGWRSLYFRDPEDNEVELVCYDSEVR